MPRRSHIRLPRAALRGSGDPSRSVAESISIAAYTIVSAGPTFEAPRAGSAGSLALQTEIYGTRRSGSHSRSEPSPMRRSEWATAADAQDPAERAAGDREEGWSFAPNTERSRERRVGTCESSERPMPRDLLEKSVRTAEAEGARGQPSLDHRLASLGGCVEQRRPRGESHCSEARDRDPPRQAGRERAEACPATRPWPRSHGSFKATRRRSNRLHQQALRFDRCKAVRSESPSTVAGRLPIRPRGVDRARKPAEANTAIEARRLAIDRADGREDHPEHGETCGSRARCCVGDRRCAAAVRCSAGKWRLQRRRSRPHQPVLVESCYAVRCVLAFFCQAVEARRTPSAASGVIASATRRLPDYAGGGTDSVSRAVGGSVGERELAHQHARAAKGGPSVPSFPVRESYPRSTAG